MKYVFLGSLLPPLYIGSTPDFGFNELVTFFKEKMSSKDFSKVTLIRRYIDLKNVCNFLKNEPLDVRGNLTEKELDEALPNRENLPDYLFEYLDRYDSEKEQASHFSYVFAEFFKEIQSEENGFLKFYFCFEREGKLILTGYRAKKLKVDLIKQLQYEDFTDPIVAELLAQKDNPTYEFPFEYMDLGKKLKEGGEDPMEKYQIMAEYRFDTIENEICDKPFSLDYQLGYLVQHMIVEDGNNLDEKQGKKRLFEMIEGSK